MGARYLGILAKERVEASKLCAPFNYIWNRDYATRMKCIITDKGAAVSTSNMDVDV